MMISERPIEATLLGSAQDGGVPQAGCRCPRCADARRDPSLRRMVTCLALVDHVAGASWMIDATPDFPRQLDMLAELAPDAPLAGIILTHAHIGHYCPDIDRWEQWGHDLPAFLADVDIALLDGSFYSDGELPGRDMSTIPHPLVHHTVALLEGSGRSSQTAPSGSGTCRAEAFAPASITGTLCIPGRMLRPYGRTVPARATMMWPKHSPPHR